MRVLQRGSRPSTLAKAVGELGRVAKTLFLLAYVDDESYRRRVLTQLNRQESRYKLARTVFHGRRGEIRKRYREGHEDKLSPLGLVVNAVVLWTTRYQQAALDAIQAKAPRSSTRTWPGSRRWARSTSTYSGGTTSNSPSHVGSYGRSAIRRCPRTSRLRPSYRALNSCLTDNPVPSGLTQPELE